MPMLCINLSTNFSRYSFLFQKTKKKWFYMFWILYLDQKLTLANIVFFKPLPFLGTSSYLHYLPWESITNALETKLRYLKGTINQSWCPSKSSSKWPNYHKSNTQRLRILCLTPLKTNAQVKTFLCFLRSFGGFGLIRPKGIYLVTLRGLVRLIPEGLQKVSKLTAKNKIETQYVYKLLGGNMR